MYETAIGVLLQHAQELETDASILTDPDESQDLLDAAAECKEAAAKLQHVT